jgi:hypothetical protein
MAWDADTCAGPTGSNGTTAPVWSWQARSAAASRTVPALRVTVTVIGPVIALPGFAPPGGRFSVTPCVVTSAETPPGSDTCTGAPAAHQLEVADRCRDRGWSPCTAPTCVTGPVKLPDAEFVVTQPLLVLRTRAVGRCRDRRQSHER